MIGKIIWIYGMPGSGKTTLGIKLANDLGFQLIDGDIIRGFFDTENDFTPEGRRAHQYRLRAHLDSLLDTPHG